MKLWGCGRPSAGAMTLAAALVLAGSLYLARPAFAQEAAPAEGATAVAPAPTAPETEAPPSDGKPLGSPTATAPAETEPADPGLPAEAPPAEMTDHGDAAPPASGHEAPAAHGEAEGHGEAAAHGEGEGHGEAEGGHAGGWKPPLWSVTGFVLMLLSIAVIPLVKPHWWEHNSSKAIVSAILGVPMGIYVISHDWVHLLLTMHEYEQFLILLASLFVISGGIWLSGDVKASPRNNTIFIAIGAVLASFIGTTGAAMLLIRPLLTTNQERKHVVHTVVFFIFLVANIGGLLTPLGDPPLFLGYLKGVPFVWTFNLWHIWLPTVMWLLFLYFIIDSYIYKNKETDEAKKWDETDIQPLKLRGGLNFLFLFGVVLSIYFYPDMKNFMIEHLHVEEEVAEFIPIREFLMILMAVLSWVTTKMEYRKAQNFTWNPILEVAILFAAIFVTMIPALIILNQWGPTSPIRHPWHFFWVTGALSSFLDNAPTYLVFLSLASGQGAAGEAAVHLGGGVLVKEISLVAISVGAVFMGANTYIGNAPNFMVKAISEENKIKMPSFFGYMAWSVGILVPTFVVITLLMFL